MRWLRPAIGGLCLCCCTAAYAELLPVRDLNPLLSGYELPSALGHIPGDSEFSTEFAVANISLEQHSATETLQLDAELQRWQISFTKPLTDTLAVRIDLPYVRISGGRLDNFIESFHDTFGLPNGNRDLWPVKRLWVQHVRNGQQDYALSNAQGGIGDLTLRAGKQWNGLPRFNTALWLSVKLPTGNAGKLTGSDSTDVALSLVGSQELGMRFTTEQQVSISRLGTGRRLSSQQEEWVWSGSLGLDTRLASQWSATIQFDGHTRVLDSEARALGSALQLSFGPRYRSAAWSGVLLLSEDIAVDTAPDVQLQLQVSKTFQ